MRRECLQRLLREHGRIVVALSGGTDSAVLLAAAVKSGIEVAAVSVDTGLAPAGEMEAAARTAEALGVEHTIIPIDMLAEEAVRTNAPERCYVCKRRMMEAIVEHAHRNGCAAVADGTHADDDPADRPGVRALHDLGVISPFARCGIGKAEICALAREWSMPVRPSSSCLVTRLPFGTTVTPAILRRIDRAEAVLREAIPGRVRVRPEGGLARIEVPAGYEETAQALIPRIIEIGFEDATVEGQ
ncbi:ATP-dependent sacrificial sulfur transferase LarE [Methanofollis fontis]|uniref:TIGR00268 family protein n=1 Tax=Methanofollis fontis TaxID=2052832 RepID=A0A483CSS9_9EURY|nr:ATP-dependent sacrificial sulfur transferase LarE [Methanofollis fontis]TAJ44260.1 TIGR00268 family protein [Methanofollis fontis]